MRWLFVSIALIAPALAAYKPDLRHIQPRGGQQGTEVVLKLHGERLRQPRELLLQQPGIEVLSLEEQVTTEEKRGKKHEVRKGKVVIARIRIAADAPLGEHPIRLRTDGGVSYLRSFWVGSFPSKPEEEPNNQFENPQEISGNLTVHGVVTSEDVDVYSISLKKGDVLSAEVEGMRLGRVFFDTQLTVLDPNGFEIASCDDATLLRTDAFVSIIAPVDGSYRIAVREAAYQGGNSSQYRLHIGNFPRPSAVLPPCARPGETVSFRFIGDPAGELTRTITIPSDASGRFPVFAERNGVSSPSPNWIEVSPLPYVPEKEPNNSAKQATDMSAPPSVGYGTILSPRDVDRFRFEGKKNRNYDIRVRARSLRSPLDAVIVLRDAQGKSLANNDDQNGPDPLIRWKCPSDGVYEVSIMDKLGRSGPDYTYRLEVGHRGPSISATLPLADRNDSQARKMVCIPRGNLYATPVNISRSNIGCAAEFEALSLPAGVSIEVPPIPRPLNSFPVLFRASADAPIDGGNHRFRIRSVGEGVPQVEGPLAETIHHIEINNQGAYHTWRSEDIAVAVIEEAPLGVRVDRPAIPLVPRGTIKLPVHIDRRGYDGKVTLRFLWRPPGIGAQDRLPVEAGKSEALYEINASADAPAGEWPIAVLAEALTPQGPIVVSTELVTVRVVEPWVSASIDLGATEQGRDVSVVCQLDHSRGFSGKARAELVGLPHGATTSPITFTSTSPTLTFAVKIAKDAAVGKHSGLFLKIQIPNGGGHVLHQCGQGGILRIDKPRKQVAERSPEPGKPTTKPLSRLEQLRQQSK